MLLDWKLNDVWKMQIGLVSRLFFGKIYELKIDQSNELICGGSQFICEISLDFIWETVYTQVKNFGMCKI